MTLNAMSGVATCNVAEENGKLRITILPNVIMTGYGPSVAADTLFAPVGVAEDDVHQYLKSKGFTGADLIGSINFVEEAEDLPDSKHNRVVLLELIQILFSKADTDGDGKISMTEFKDFCTEFGLNFGDESASEIFIDYDKDRRYLLTFEEFKTLLLKTKLVALRDGNINKVAAEFGIHPALQGLFWDHFWNKADKDNSGVVSLDEVLQLFEDYGLGDVKNAKSAFDEFDLDGDGKINKKEFILMMCVEGVVSIEPPKTKSESGCAIL